MSFSNSFLNNPGYTQQDLPPHKGGFQVVADPDLFYGILNCIVRKPSHPIVIRTGLHRLLKSTYTIYPRHPVIAPEVRCLIGMSFRVQSYRTSEGVCISWDIYIYILYIYRLHQKNNHILRKHLIIHLPHSTWPVIPRFCNPTSNCGYHSKSKRTTLPHGENHRRTNQW